nr:AraC family transcriptional regulator [Acutalibacter muris]
MQEIRSFSVLVCSHVFLDGGRRTVAPEENALFLSFLSRLESARYRRDFCDQAESFFRELASMLSSRRVPRRRQVIEEVRRYIGEHLEDSLTLRDISAQVYLAPTYLCTLFKEETGSTINAYLTHQRMLYAARLLSTGRYRVYELARRLGYSDVKYFSSLFKRYLGQSPSRYGDGAGKEDADEAP